MLTNDFEHQRAGVEPNCVLDERDRSPKRLLENTSVPKAIELKVVLKTRCQYIPCKLDCGILAADGPDNNFQLDHSLICVIWGFPTVSKDIARCQSRKDVVK
jgi:hypothetical protein